VTNYWPPVDGILPGFEDPARTSSEIVRDRLLRAALARTSSRLDRAWAAAPGTDASSVVDDACDA